MMGFLKDLTREVQKKPWVPFSKKEAEPSGEAPAAHRAPGRKAASVCDPASNLPCVTVCVPTAGCSCGCEEIRSALAKEIADAGLPIHVGSAKVGCAGSCASGPFIGFPHKGFFYLGVRVQDIPAVVKETLKQGRILFDHISINPDRAFRSDIHYEKDTGLIAAIHDRICMVEVAKYFLNFEENVSCGLCVPCRMGMRRVHEIIDRIMTGAATLTDLEQLLELCQVMITAPHCDFAMTSTRPVLSAVTYFADEFKAHIEKRQCPAGLCEFTAEPPKEKEAAKPKKKKEEAKEDSGSASE